jgi:hypothetical protein
MACTCPQHTITRCQQCCHVMYCHCSAVTLCTATCAPPSRQPVVSEEYAIKMEASLKAWTSAWDSKGYSPDQLDKG